MADFRVQYDVVMEDIIGDVQVWGPREVERAWAPQSPRPGQGSGLDKLSIKSSL
jgi:hypothetical protein